jgi:hypothetical protein
MKMHKIFPLVAALAAVGSAHADGIGARVGTTGIGGDVAWSVAPALSARIGYSAGSYKRNITTSDARYDGKLKLSNANVFLDFGAPAVPRLTVGFLGNFNKIDVTGQANDGTSLSGTIKWSNKAAPYLGFGYGNVAGTGVNFYFDLGVAYLGTPKSSLNCGSSSVCAAEQATLDDKIKKYKYLPVASIGFTIGF